MKKIAYFIVMLLAANFSIASAAEKSSQETGDLTLSVLSEAAFTGMQLSVKKAVQDGKAKASMYECISALKSSSFISVYEPFFTQQFTTEEQMHTEEFFSGVVGKKYAKHGVLQIYAATGLAAPEPLPTFSPEEMGALEAFSQTTAGGKLMVKRIMQSPAINSAVQSKIGELLSSCRK